MSPFLLRLYLITITNESTFEKSIQTVAYPAVGQEEFICTVTDENDNTSTISFKVTTILTDPGISVYTGISLGSWNSTTNSSFASITGQTYGIAEAAADSIQSKIDWVYFNGTSYGNTLMSPSDTLVENVYPSIENWTVRNQTRFTKTTYGPDIFDIIENDNQLIVFINTGNLNFVYDFYSELLSNPGGFAVNDVLAFETHTGKYGFIKITAVNPGTSNDLSTITYDLKVMK